MSQPRVACRAALAEHAKVESRPGILDDPSPKRKREVGEWGGALLVASIEQVLLIKNLKATFAKHTDGLLEAVR